MLKELKGFTPLFFLSIQTMETLPGAVPDKNLKAL